MELVEKKKFVAVALNSYDETFIVSVVFLISSNPGLKIYPFYRIQITSFKTYEASIIIFFKYTNFVDIFAKNSATKLLDYTKINHYTVDLFEDL